MPVNWMFPHLDNVTVDVTALVITFIATIWLLVAARINQTVRGFRSVALGLAATWLGSVLAVLRVAFDFPVISLASNILVLGGVVCSTNGIRIFRQRTPLPFPAMFFTLALIAISYLYYMLVNPTPGMRTAVTAPFLAFLAVDAAISMAWRVPRRDRLVYWQAAAGLGFTALVLAVRAFGAVAVVFGNHVFRPSLMSNMMAIASASAWVGQAMGMVLASNAEAKRAVERASLYDPLTGLPNRRLLMDHLTDAEHQARERGLRLGIIYLDLDGFKSVNDSLGHDAGDELLRSLAESMRQNLDSSCFLSRVGGDEFVVLVPNPASHADLDRIAAQLTASVARERLPHGPALGVSCGKAVFPVDGETARDAMRAADAAMYVSKRARRSVYAVSA